MNEADLKVMSKKSPEGTLEYRLENDTLVLRLFGRLTRECEQGLQRVATDLIEKTKCGGVEVDVSSVEYVDSSGVALIALIKRVCLDKNRELRITGIGQRLQGMLRWVNLDEIASRTVRREKHLNSKALATIGETALSVLYNMRFMLAFLGEVVISMAYSLRRPRSIRLRDMLECLERTGADALPIVALINFLVGLIMAFQAGVQLRQFGANIFVADLVGIGQVREFGPMITAILLAGRSGSAFAAEIGTMEVGEEVDALRTMGFDPTRFLVVPKIIALFIALPLLTLYADLVGIAGGLLVGILNLGLTFQGYLVETQKAVGLSDVFSGVLKSLAFALLIAGIGCLRGFQVKGGAEAVGRSTTSAVVTGIFFIILTDAIFTVMFHYV